MLKEKYKFFDRDNKKMIYGIFLLPYISFFIYKFLGANTFVVFWILLIPIFLGTLLNLRKFNNRIFGDKGTLFFARSYLLAWFISLFYWMLIWAFYDKLLLSIFLYIISSLIYIDRVYLIYYYFYRKIISHFLDKLINIFKFIYIKFITASIPILFFLFAIYIFGNLDNFSISNIYLKSFITFLNNSFFSGFHHTAFYKLLYLSILVILSLIILRYIKNIWFFLSKLIFNFSTFLFFILWTTLGVLIFQYKWVISNVNLSMTFYLSTFLFIFLYLFFISLKQFFWMNWEWKNSIYKKLYNKLYWKNLKVNFFSVIKNTHKDNYIDKFLNDLNTLLDKFISYKSRNKDYLVLKNDVPITLWDNDLLWIGRFTKSIFDVIEWYSFVDNHKSSFSIGLVWEWWWWKTSVINLLREEFLDWYPWYKVYDFNPWNYEKKDLIEKFFLDLWVIIGDKKISKLLKQYLLSLWELHKWFKIIGKIFWDSSLDVIKSKLSIELSKLNNTKIVVVIDDLDRCEPEEIIVMLNIIKNLWSLSNIIYLVSYDKDNIIKVLEEKWFDSSYLEKIINFERFLPVNNQKVLSEYFFEWFSDIVDEVFEKKENIKKVTEPFIKNIESLTNVLKPLQDNIKKIWEYINSISWPIQRAIQNINIWDKEDIEQKQADQKDNKEGKTNEYQDINKEELLSYLEWELSYLFQNSNLRLLKKLLNHLKIVFITNMYTMWELKRVFEFTKEDYLNIIIINYIKLTDYKWFLEVINYKNNTFWWDRSRRGVSYDEKDIPNVFKRFYYEDEQRFKGKFLLLIFDLHQTQESRKDEDNPSISHITITWIDITPKNISENLEVILEKFN